MLETLEATDRAPARRPAALPDGRRRPDRPRRGHRPRRRHVRLRAADAARPHRVGARPRRPHQPAKRRLRARPGAARRGLRVPGLRRASRAPTSATSSRSPRSRGLRLLTIHNLHYLLDLACAGASRDRRGPARRAPPGARRDSACLRPLRPPRRALRPATRRTSGPARTASGPGSRRAGLVTAVSGSAGSPPPRSAARRRAGRRAGGPARPGSPRAGRRSRDPAAPARPGRAPVGEVGERLGGRRGRATSCVRILGTWTTSPWRPQPISSSTNSWNWAARSTRAGTGPASMSLLVGELRRAVAAAEAVGADDRDDHDPADAGRAAGLLQVAGRGREERRGRLPRRATGRWPRRPPRPRRAGPRRGPRR